MNNEILWVGVSFDPSDDSDYANAQHEAVVEALIEPVTLAQVVSERFPSGAQIDTYHGPAGTLVDIFDRTHTRIGFGIRVDTIAEGRMKIGVTCFVMRGLGVTLHVSVWTWNPTGMPSSMVRHAGVEQMLSLDLA